MFHHRIEDRQELAQASYQGYLGGTEMGTEDTEIKQEGGAL
jgi:hypothetical protein